MISEDELNEHYGYCIKGPIGFIWSDQYGSLERNKEVFFYKLERWMNDGLLLLGKDGKLLSGTIDEQIDLIRNSFPSDEEMKEVQDLWWYTDKSPANNAVWILDHDIEALKLKPYKDGNFLYWTA